jgi:hypothetical protein
MVKMKNVGEWLDKDNTKRCSKVPLITKVKIQKYLLSYLNRMPIKKIALKFRISYYRLKKGFNAISHIHGLRA